MYTIIIVDDEPLVRKRIRFGFDWEQIGYTIIGEAQNGQEAIDLLRSLKPDVAIVDVMMPIMNGMELAAYVKEEGIPTELVFLSAHSEFVYAQKAISFGVRAYVLKPIDEELFIGILQEIHKQLDTRKVNKSHLKELVQQNEIAKLLMTSKRLCDCLYGTSNQAVPDEPFLKQNQKTAFFAMRTADSASEIERLVELQGDITRMIEESYDPRVGHAVFLDLQSNGLICILQLPTILEAHCFAEKLACCFSGQEDTVEHFGYCVDGEYPQPDGFLHAYEALNLTRYMNTTFAAYETHRESIRRYSMDGVVLREIISSVTVGDSDVLKNSICRVFHELAMHCAPAQDLMETCQVMMRSIRPLAGEETSGASLGEYSNLASLLSSLWEVEKLCDWFCAFAEETLQTNRSGNAGQKKYTKIISRAKQIIQQEYTDSSFSLSTVAQRLNISPSYFSGAFKAAEGISAVQYCSLVRLEQANKLLKETHLSIREIALQCGFNDEYYFSKCYKKYYGYSPSRIRIEM